MAGRRSPFTLRQPGYWIDDPSRERAHELEGIVRDLKKYFIEASAALLLYQKDRQSVRRSPMNPPDPAAVEAQATIAELLLAQPETFDEHEGPRLFHERATDYAIQSGEIPHELIDAHRTIHARAFLYAVSTVRKMVEKFPEPQISKDATAEMQAAFPNAVGLRDSAQHAENRNRSQDRRGKPLPLKPIDNRMISAPGGALLIDCFNGDTFSMTLEDGSLGEIDVTDASLTRLRDIIERVYGRLTWQSGPRFGEERHPNVLVDEWTLNAELQRRASKSEAG